MSLVSKKESSRQPETPLISVLLPVYNGGKYLREAVTSILGQTYENFELIIINDGSTDNTMGVINLFNDDRIKVISRANLGLITSLNEGIDIASGEWIARMDADDIALPQRFERQLAWLQETGADICGSWVSRFGSEEKRIVRPQEKDDEIKIDLLFYSSFVHPSVLGRAAVFKKLRYDQDTVRAEDYDLWFRAAVAGYTMTNIPEVLLLYRVHDEQVSAEYLATQLEQTNKIRYRYWQAFCHARSISTDNLSSGLEIFHKQSTNLNMAAVEELFYGLIKACSEAEKMRVISHLEKLYLLAAADCKGVVSSWRRLTEKLGMTPSSMMILKLQLFHIFKVRENTFLHTWIRKAYLYKESLAAK